MAEFSIGALVERITNQSASNGIDTLVSWNNTVWDDAGFFNGGNPTRLTAPQAGWYTIYASVRWASAATGERDCWIKLNGSFTFGPVGSSFPAGTVASTYSNNVFGQFKFNKGDYVEIDCFQNSGGALNITAASVSMLRAPANVGASF